MMVKERRYVFGVEDISSLIYACPHCGQEVECRLTGNYRPGAHCISCGEDLMTASIDEGLDPNDVLLRNLRRVRRIDDPRVRVSFVVPDPDN